MVLNYGSSPIPSDNYQVTEGGTVQVSSAFERSIGLVGAMDTANGSANTDEVYEIANESDAETQFGADSELARQTELAYENGVTTVNAVAVPETNTTESFSTTESDTLGNAPVFNPELHSYYDITAQDTTEGASVTVNIVYEQGTITAPSDANTINLNPITGEWKADESSSYDITYSYGDYSTALDTLASDPARMNVAFTESESLSTDFDSDIQDNADNFEYGHGVVGAHPFADPNNPDTANYSDSLDTERLSVVASPYGYIDDAETEMVRSYGAVAAEMASLPLGVSATNNNVGGLTGLRTDLSPQDASDLIDAQVLPLIDYPPVTIVKDMTTSTTAKFERVYAMNVIDEVLTLSHEINGEFIGDQASEEKLQIIDRSLRNMLLGLVRLESPLLDTAEDGRPYAVNVTRSSSSDNVVIVSMGIDIIGVIDEIDVNLRVGDIVTVEEVS